MYNVFIIVLAFKIIFTLYLTSVGWIPLVHGDCKFNKPSAGMHVRVLMSSGPVKLKFISSQILYARYDRI